MNRKWMVGSAAAVAVTGLVGGSAQAAHIDTFDDGAFDLTVDEVGEVATDSQDGLDTDEVLGGSREVELEFVSSDGTVNEVSAEGAPGAGLDGTGRLSFSADSGEEGRLNLFYGFSGPGDSNDIMTNPSGPDYDGFRFEFAQSDAGTDFEVTVTDTGIDSVTKTTTASTEELLFGFDEFSGVDFTNVDSIEVDIDGAVDGDYTLAAITRTSTAVPSPAALPAGMLMLGGLLLSRRRKQA